MTLLECYRILDIHHGASWVEIKRAYRDLAKQHHPDKNQGNPAYDSQFKQITRAYQILDGHFRKDKSRSQVDEVPNAESCVPTKYSEPVNIQIDRSKRPRPFEKWVKKIHDTFYQCERMWFPLDVYQGVTIDERYAQIGGVIRVKTVRDIVNVKLPAGAKHGLILRVTGKGQKSLFYDKRGDLYLNLRVVPVGTVRPGHTNLFYDMKIRKGDFGTGKVFTLLTLQGPIKFFPPKTTLDGQTFVLKARPDEPSSKKINHILTVQII